LGYVLPFGQMSLWGYEKSLKYSIIKLNKSEKNGFIDFIIPLFYNSKYKYKGWQRIGPHNNDILSIIFGSLLGDAHAEKRKGGVGTRITFYQEDSHVKYLYWLHALVSDRGYCNSSTPLIKSRLGKGGKIRKVVRFNTWTYTSFNWIHDIWYDNKKKRVPLCIKNYLSPLALAIWIMDDGAKVSNSLKLSTNSFTYSECLLLVNTLNDNFNLKCTIQLAGAKDKDQFIIYVLKESMPLLREIVNPYIIPEMKYKII